MDGNVSLPRGTHPLAVNQRSWTPYAGARERDALSTQTAGPPLAHTIPSFSELTSADIAIVNYLQDQGLSP